MIRSLNGLGNNININTISGGDAIEIESSNSTASTCNLKISKQSANTSIADTDIFVLEDDSGNIRKITGSDMKSELEQSDVTEPLALTGNTISIKGLSGFTPNKFLKVNSGGTAIEYADSTNFWTYSSPSLRPDNTTDNLLLGTTSNTNSRKLLVTGDTELEDVYLKSNKKIISTNNSSDYLQFGNGTFTNNYASNIFSTGISFLSGDLQLPSGSGISLGASSTDKMTLNSGNFTFGNTGIFNNSVIVKSTDSTNSGSVSFFEAGDNGTNNIDLHCPLITTHNYNAYLPKITNTGVSSVYILSNQNILAGTNVSISGTETITINSTDTNTEYTGGTNITLSGTQFNLDSTLSGAMTFSNLTTFNLGLAVKNSDTNVSGGVQFYNKDNTNYVDLRLQNEDVDSNISVFLPTTLDEDVLVGRQTTDVLQNKTFNSNTQFNLAIQLYNIQAAAITSSLQASQTGLVLTGSTVDVDTNMKFRNTADQDDYLQIRDDLTFNFNNMKVKQDSKLVNTSNTECFLKFQNTVLENTFIRSDFVQLRIKKNDGYTAGPQNGYIELEESASSSSNTTRLYFNSAGTAYIYWDGTNLVATQNTFSGSDQRFKKNESLANTTELSNAFDNIDIYKYQYEEQYAVDKGSDLNEFVYGFIAQNVKENTDNLSSQFSSVGKGQGIYPNEKIDYDGDRLVVDNVLTINKTDMNLILWGKIKEQQKQIDHMMTVIDKLTNSKTFKDFKS